MNDDKARIWRKADTGLRVLLFLICMGFVLGDLFVIFSRMFYPYQLEWLEGASLIQVKRLVAGQALYTPPSIYYVPLVYPPLFFYAGKAIAAIIGLGFGALRLVSFLSSVVCALCIYMAIADKTNIRFASWLGVGCLASTFLLTGQWFDIARTDMFAAAISILAMYMGREKEDSTGCRINSFTVCCNVNLPIGLKSKLMGETGGNNLRILISGVLFALALLAKQSALLVGCAAVLYYLLFNWRRGIWLGLSFGLSFTILYVIFWFRSGGWISYYLFTLPSAHAFDFKLGHILSILISQFSPIPIFLILALLPAALTPREIFGDRLYRYYYLMSATLILTGVIGRTNAFSGRNVYIPSYLGIALLVGLEAGWLIEKIPRSERNYPLIVLEWLLISIQLVSLTPAYLHTKMIPSMQDRSTGNRLVARIKRYKGDVLLLKDNYLALYAGKTPYYNQIPMSEISGQGNLYPMPEWSVLRTRINLLFHAPTTSAIFAGSIRSIKRLTVDCKQQSIPYPDKIVFTPVAGPPNSRPNLIITCR